MKLITVSIDSIENHRAWIKQVEELQDCKVWFPIVGDSDAEICRRFNLVKDKAVDAKRNLRPTTMIMVIDVDKRIRQVQYYPVHTGQ